FDRLLDRLSLKQQLMSIVYATPFIRSPWINSAGDRHQGRFARAHFTARAMNLAALDLERNVIQSRHTAKAFGDVLDVVNDIIRVVAHELCILDWHSGLPASGLLRFDRKLPFRIRRRYPHRVCPPG